MPEVNDDQTPEPETRCGRCGQPAPEGADWCTSCEEANAEEALAALRGRLDEVFADGNYGYTCIQNSSERGWVSGSGGTEDDIELCPQATVPCERNAFDMCRTCGRDLSGNAP